MADQDNETSRLNQHQIQNVTGNADRTYNDDLDQHNTHGHDEDEGDGKKKIKYFIIGGVVVLAIALIVTLSVTLPNKGGGIIIRPNAPLAPPPTPPYISDPVPPPGTYNSYVVDPTSQVVDQDTTSGYILGQPYDPAALAAANRRLLSSLSGPQQHLYSINSKAIPSGVNNNFATKVAYKFGMPSFNIALLQMADANSERFSIPTVAANKPGFDSTMRLEMLGFMLTADPFTFSFRDVLDSTNVFIHNANSNLVFMDKYIQMDLQLPSRRIYGFGERVHEFGLGEGTWTMWAKGQDSPYDDGTGGKQVYGVHPFILVQTKNPGDFIGLYFRNSNAQSPLVIFNDDGTSTLSYITTGGAIELYFFIHGSAKQIIQNYHNVIGRAYLPPFWALGWQQASWKYETQNEVQNSIDAYATAGMPLETMYLDIPYMKKYADFSVDTVAFPNIQDLAMGLHNNNQRLVVILDAGLSADDSTSPYYKSALNLKTLIMSAINTGFYGGALVQHVWPSQTVFLDWFNTNSDTVWWQGLNDLFAQVPYDGLWIDMNEATGFCSGECPQQKTQSAQEVEINSLLRKLRAEEEAIYNADDAVDATSSDESWYYSYHYQKTNSTYFLPFIPGFLWGGNLDNMSLSLNATHPALNNETEYNVHNLYGLMMARSTQNFLYQNQGGDVRPYVISRSTFAGAGRFTSHWLGDNWRDWAYMNYSIAGIMNMNMFGISHAGADVCGFFGQDMQSPEMMDMCSRWIQLSTFYPLARSHQNLTYMDKDSDPSEPFRLTGDYLTIAKASMWDRYQYLRHMYTCMYEVNQWGGTCFDPLFYYYPTDDNLFINIESSFIVGGALKVSPILTPGFVTGQTYSAYFPAGVWVNLKTFEVIHLFDTGAYIDLTAQETVNVHLREGTLVAFQNLTNTPIKTTVDLVMTAPITIVVNRNPDGYAEGSVMLDNGTSQYDQFHQAEYIKFAFSSQTLTKEFVQGQEGSHKNFKLDQVVITNAADLKFTNFACALDEFLNPISMNYYYNPATQTLNIFHPTYPATNLDFSSFKMIQFGNSLAPFKDINLCDPFTYQYKIVGGVVPDLNGTSATFTIQNLASGLEDLQVTLRLTQSNIINIQWTYATQPKNYRTPFTVPKNIVNPVISKKGGSLANFVYITANPFFMSINSVEGTHNTVLDLTGIVYDEWLNLIKVRLYEKADAGFSGVFGLGERVSADIPYQNGVYSMWNRDTANTADYGDAPAENSYGTHPFYMFRSDRSIWTGVYTNLNHAQDWIIQNTPENGWVDVTTVANGGIADMYIIIGYDPKQITSDYWNFIVGKPVLPPVYALGWNQCKWGYKTTQDLIDVVNSYIQAGIPLDNQWSDIDYMDTYRDFTFDQQRFYDLPIFVQALHAEGKHYVPIIDAGFAARPNGNYASYNSGDAAGIFTKANFDMPTENFIGSVWPNEAVYPDWFNPATQSWYLQQVNTFHSQVAFDGLWLDMNEASNFCNGPCQPSQKPASSVLANLKYIPSNRNLNEKSISVDAYHYGNILEFDVHSLFGTQEVIAANQYFTTNNLRPFIISRSSFAGMGKYGSMWLGDNWSAIDNLQNSIIGIQQANMFGVSLAGVDICGFIGTTTPELCARWTVVGAFYPFSRNHNNYGAQGQEPYQPWFQTEYEPGVTYTSIMKQGIINKYHLMKYYYTQMFLQSMYGTAPFFSPMFFVFPDDHNSFVDYDRNIMLGPHLKLSVNTFALGTNTTQFYWGPGTWCNIFVPTEPCFTSPGGSKGYITRNTKAYDFYVHMFQGSIVPMQDATKLGVQSTGDLQKYPVDFHILGSAGKVGMAWYAMGLYVNDDGVTSVIKNNFNQYSIAAMADAADPFTITINIAQAYNANNYFNKISPNCYAVNQNDMLGNIYIYNAKAYGYLTKSSWQATFTFTSSSRMSSIISYGSYDSFTDRLVIPVQANPLCLTAISSISFKGF